MKASVVTVLAALIPAHSALAQTEELVLQEVTVTATKRTESLQDVPISVAVVDGALLSSYGIADLNEARQYIPNLQYQEGTEGASIVMRGFGNSGGTNFGFDSPVGTFVDGVYHGRLNQTRLAFMDLERIEVLRGPQSTLFGMNTVAGAISVISRQPTDSFEASFRAEYDPKYGNGELQGVISGPLTETVSARLAVMTTDEDGYLKNTFLDRDFGGFDDDAARLTLRWNPTDQLTVSTKLEYAKRFQNGVNAQALTPPSDPATLARMIAADPQAAFSPDDLDVSTGNFFRDIESKEAVVTVDYAFDSFTVTSLTAYSDFLEKSWLDLAYSPIPLGQTRAIEDFDQVSQELRIASSTPGRLSYLAGIYYQRSTLEHKRPLDFILGNYVPAFAGTPSGELQTYAGDFEQTYKTLAGFGQATLSITDALRVTAGARYSSERKNASSHYEWLVPGTTGTENALTPGTPEFAAADLVFNSVFRIVRHRDSGRYKENSFLPELKLQWDASDDINLYAGFGKGEKAGGFNDRDNRAINFSFDPETSTNYEIGTKMRLLGGAAQLDVAIFHTQFEDMQVSVFDLPNLVFIVDNAAQATTEGIELEGRWRLSQPLTLNAAFGWLHKARFDQFLVQCVAGPADPACLSTPDGDFRDDGGNDLNAPKYTGNVGLEYNHELSSGRSFTARGDVAYRSGSEDLVNRVGRVTSATFVNGLLGIQSERGWNYALVLKNITDERHVSTRSTSLFPGMFTGEVSPPRTVAVQVGYSFK